MFAPWGKFKTGPQGSSSRKIPKASFLQVDSLESYGNNTLKSLHGLKYVLGLDWSRLNGNGKPPKFLFRADDDIYLNLPLVKKLIIDNTEWDRCMIAEQTLSYRQYQIFTIM
jgi:hypothetical protein